MCKLHAKNPLLFTFCVFLSPAYLQHLPVGFIWFYNRNGGLKLPLGYESSRFSFTEFHSTCSTGFPLAIVVNENCYLAGSPVNAFIEQSRWNRSRGSAFFSCSHPCIGIYLSVNSCWLHREEWPAWEHCRAVTLEHLPCRQKGCDCVGPALGRETEETLWVSPHKGVQPNRAEFTLGYVWLIRQGIYYIVWFRWSLWIERMCSCLRFALSLGILNNC